MAHLSEADTCRKFVLPKLYAAGWNDDQISEQRSFTDGRIVIAGSKAIRKKQKRADYLLRYRRDFSIAVVEAKAEYKKPADGLQQAKDYAEILDLKFAYSTNGHGIVEHDFATGIRDVVTLKRSAVKDGRIFVRTHKAGTQVLVPVPPAVIEALNQVPVVNPNYFFWSGTGLPKSSVANWQRSLRTLFELAGIEKGHAHRMRVTMAVELLKRGVSVENVAAILGSTPLIVQKHYAPFVQARQLILEKQVMATW